MLYIIGLGLNENGISLEGKEAVKKCNKVYLEAYTADFPYDIENLEKSLEVNMEKLGRDGVESDKLVEEAKEKDVALLVYGSPLFATTHETLLLDAKKAKVNIKVIYSAGIFDALGETGLQLYKFGKVTSMPRWQKNFAPTSFMDVVKENQGIKAHSLILTDIGLSLLDSVNELKTSADEKKIKLNKIVVCSQLGTENAVIIYDNFEDIKKKKIKHPFCLVIPSELHFIEKEALEKWKS
jgi:diphthine synthase